MQRGTVIYETGLRNNRLINDPSGTRLYQKV